MKKAYIILENGMVFEGFRFGAERQAAGELVFTTGMGGYIETLSDPGYCGQIVVQTFPLIGNYGMIAADMESEKSYLNGYIVREWCERPSNFRMEQTVDAYLKKAGIPGVYGVDTRQITRVIRDNGVMGAMISDNIPEDLSILKNYRIQDAATAAGCTESVLYAAKNPRYNVTLVDFGTKRKAIRQLNALGCTVKTVPYNASETDILADNPDGVVLSNGPGDPAEQKNAIETIRCLAGKKPLLGIGLGHQLLAFACGAKTYRLKYGHRGANQPVKDLATGRVYITSQNHGYAADSDSIEACGGKVGFVNVNDATCEGAEYPGKKAFSVQFEPEACSGPQDTGFLFERFLDMMEAEKHAVR